MKFTVPAPHDALRVALLSALGVAQLACGGTATSHAGDGGNETGGSQSTGGAESSGGSSAGGTSSGGAVGSGGTLGTSHLGLCSSPEPLIAGHDTGVVRCGEAYEHVVERRECPSFLPRVEEAHEPDPGNECEVDTDCTGENDYCGVSTDFVPSFPRVCFDGCLSDAECDPGNICRCGDPVGICVPAACQGDADCAGGALCVGVQVRDVCGFFQTVFVCQSAADECNTNADCSEPNAECVPGVNDRRVCQTYLGSPCGRPFLVDFLERRALPAACRDWTIELPAPELAGLGAAQRARLAEHWADIALMEHASIAAFARFSLQLLSFGAPVDLIEETNRALIDETKHARLCFALASAYAGEPIGPGPLAIEGSLEGDSPEVILRTVIREGCLGESQAALEAAHALSLCEDEVVSEVLEQIANDEARHAELAWRFVQWLLGERPELRSVAREEFALALSRIDAEHDLTEPGELRRFGVLDESARSLVRCRALGAVVGPCAERLFEGPRPKPKATAGVVRLAFG